jgi:hypothetical protein
MSIWTLEIVESFTVKQGGRITTWAPRQRMALPPEKAQRVIDRVGLKVRVVEHDMLDHMIGTVVQASQEFLVVSPPSPVVIEPAAGPVTVDPLVGSIVLWSNERGLVRDTHLDCALRWIWVETATRVGWTCTVKAGVRCRRCQGARWWWSKAVAIPCGFSHDWVPHHNPEAGEPRGTGRPANPDHLNECCRHRYRSTHSLAILCVICHPPTPSHDDWSAAWEEIIQLRQGVTDPTIASLVQACDAAFSQGDYPAFLREWVRLAVFVGQVVRP